MYLLLFGQVINKDSCTLETQGETGSGTDRILLLSWIDFFTEWNAVGRVEVGFSNVLYLLFSLSQFCLWTDGLNVLLGKEMSSESMRSELEILLSMEIKLRLLDLENVPIPDSAPPVPKPPSNFNFCYDFSQAEQ